MRAWPQLVVLMSMIPVAVLVAGCAAAAGTAGGPGSAGRKVSVTRTTFRGWEGAYLLTDGRVEVVIVPQIARIMKYAPAGGENILWVNDELTPETTGVQALPHESPEWINYGGSKLWSAPEKDWKWPPDWELDRGPCEVEVIEDGLRVVGTPSAQHGIRFDRDITLNPDNSALRMVQTAVNVSAQPIVASIWEVSQVNSDCIGFVPLTGETAYQNADGGEPDLQWSREGNMLLLRPDGTGGKIFITGGPGILGCRQGTSVFLKSFGIDAVPPPDPETPREVYTCNLGYVELEIVGPAVTLQPGETTTVTQWWSLLSGEPGAATVISAPGDSWEVPAE